MNEFDLGFGVIATWKRQSLLKLLIRRSGMCLECYKSSRNHAIGRYHSHEEFDLNDKKYTFLHLASRVSIGISK